MYKFSQFAVYLSFSLSIVSKRLARPCSKYCNLSNSVVVNVWFTTKGMCMKNNAHVGRASRNDMSTTWDLYCCLVPQCEALRTCCSTFPITTKWCFDQDVKVVAGTTFTKRTCNRCGSLQKQGYVVTTSRWTLHWKCGFRIPNTWKWPEMNIHLDVDLNLATFQYIDEFECYHFCLNRFGLELIIFFWTSSQLLLQFSDCRLLFLSVQFWDCKLL